MKLWAKVIKKEKIIMSFVYTKEELFDIGLFYQYLSDICNEIDVETPVLLTKHIYHFTMFNSATFNSSDFIYPIKFDKLSIESIDI